MEGIFIIIGLFLSFGPIIFAVLAFNRAGRAEQQVQELRTRLLRLEMRDTPKPVEAPPPAAAPAPAAAAPDAARPAAQSAEVAHAPVAAAVAPPVLELPPVAPAPPPLPVRPSETAPPPLAPPPVPETSFEITVGGKVASFVGIGIFVIGMIDNLLRPILVGKDPRMPDFVVLIATLAGLELFGLNGFIVGPMIAALFIAVWKIIADARAEPLVENAPAETLPG